MVLIRMFLCDEGIELLGEVDWLIFLYAVDLLQGDTKAPYMPLQGGIHPRRTS